MADVEMVVDAMDDAVGPEGCTEAFRSCDWREETDEAAAVGHPTDGMMIEDSHMESCARHR